MTLDNVCVNYQGRKTSRKKSEERRRTILEAALRLVVKEGVRGIRHRAVAKEAGVSLSATTYYFKDINELISDTFTLFAEQSMNDLVTPIYSEVQAILGISGNILPHTDSEKRQLVDALSILLVGFVQYEITEKRDHLLAEQAFFHESLRNPSLRSMAQLYYGHLVQDMKQLCIEMSIDKPDVAADLLMATIFRLEQEGLQQSPEDFDCDRAKSMISRIFLSFLVTV